jgi:hypothetical protein
VEVKRDVSSVSVVCLGLLAMKRSPTSWKVRKSCKMISFLHFNKSSKLMTGTEHGVESAFFCSPQNVLTRNLNIGGFHLVTGFL